MEEKEQIHKHHIIPRYKCKELGINPDFPENIVELTRLEHAYIHWWMYLDERKDVFNLLESKGVKITSSLTEHIPWQDKRDIGAAGFVALGQIDGIDTSGENNPRWIDGRSKDKEFQKAWSKEYWQRPETKARHKKWRAQPEVKARRKKLEQTPERKAYKKAYTSEYNKRREVREKQKEYRDTPTWRERQKSYRQSPEGKAKAKEWIERPENRAKRIKISKEYNQKPENKAKAKEYYATPERKAHRRKLYHRKVDIQYFINQGLVL
jgi:hypothetical protein